MAEATKRFSKIMMQCNGVCSVCRCAGAGVADGVCSPNGQCTCLPNYVGQQCDECAPGYYGYPDCAGEWV